MLHLLGLSKTAETVYLSMLRHPKHRVAGLAADTGLREADLRAALDELGQLALLRPSDDVAGGVRPVSPSVGLASLLASMEADVAMRQAQVETARAAIAVIAADHQMEQSGEGAVVLQGIDAVRARLEELQRSAQFECLSLNPGGAHRPDARAAATPLNEEALRRGVAIRAICRDSFRNDSGTLAYVHWLTHHGGRMRTVPIVPLQMVVIDRKAVVLPLNPQQPRDGALEVRSPGVVALAQALFEQLWNVAAPFGESAQEDDHGLTPMERQLLEIIAAGGTDEVAARSLAVSLRTIRRMMASLMERLEATSRFQAGAQATKRGWI